MRSDPNAVDVVLERHGIEITVSFGAGDAWELFEKGAEDPGAAS
ncbi:MAG: hypothetical protein ACYDCK_07640 [Thermoplasmatota archaeon]